MLVHTVAVWPLAVYVKVIDEQLHHLMMTLQARYEQWRRRVCVGRLNIGITASKKSSYIHVSLFARNVEGRCS